MKTYHYYGKKKFKIKSRIRNKDRNRERKYARLFFKRYASNEQKKNPPPFDYPLIIGKRFTMKKTDVVGYYATEEDMNGSEYIEGVKPLMVVGHS